MSDRGPHSSPGAIQPIGFLVALSRDWTIACVSANIAQFVGKQPDTLIGHSVNDLFCPDAVHSLRNRLALLRNRDSMERMFRCALLGNARLFDIALHMSGGHVIVEGEPSTEHHYGDATGTVRGMIGRADQTRTMATFLNEGTRQVRALTGFERVMIARFAPDGSSEVVAESAKSGIASFLGLLRPPGDISAETREVYKRCLLRVVTDIEAPPVQIVPAGRQSRDAADLSLSVLRAASPTLIESLRSMGGRASMTIALIVGGELWGLIVCHHQAPRCPSFERRSVAELFAQMFAMRLETRELRQTLEEERRARKAEQQQQR
ncbi:MAG: GAF domain-containing protein [Sphingomicrobium sp.]